MGIYIKGMELPTENDILTIAIDRNGNVLSVFLDEERCELCLRRPKNKPVTAIHVPAHGRLIDADKMFANNETYYDQLGRPDGEIGGRYKSVKFSIALADTIIPAEQQKEEHNAAD